MMKFILFLILMILLSFLNYLLSLISYMVLFMLFLMTFNNNTFFINISYFLGCDYLSYYMVFLTIWVCMLMILSMEKYYYLKSYFSLFLLVLLVLMLSLLMTFVSMNLFIFWG